MKAKATNAMLVCQFRVNCIAPCPSWHLRVKGRIKNGHLREVGPLLPRKHHPFKVVRVVQRRVDCTRVDFTHHFIINQNGINVARSAMHNTMSDGVKLNLLALCENLLQRVSVRADGAIALTNFFYFSRKLLLLRGQIVHLVLYA